MALVMRLLQQRLLLGRVDGDAGVQLPVSGSGSSTGVGDMRGRSVPASCTSPNSQRLTLPSSSPGMKRE